MGKTSGGRPIAAGVARGRHRLSPALRALDRWVQPAMVCLSYAFLFALAIGGLPVVVVLLADALAEMRGVRFSPGTVKNVTGTLFTLLAILWPLFIFESLVRIFWLERGCGRGKRRRAGLVMSAVFPPLRLGLTPCSAPHCVWFPFVGWRSRDKLLCKALARGFSIPMILFAVSVIPLIVVEIVMTSRGTSSPEALQFFAAGTQVVWLAFAIEFFTRLAAHERKLEYCRAHWIDAAIVLLPAISFLRVARLATVMQAGRLTSMGRIYRIRGLAQRGYQALLVLRILERWSLWGARARIGSLRTKIERLEELIEDCDEEIGELEQMVKMAKAAKMRLDRERVRRRRVKRNKKAGEAESQVDSEVPAGKIEPRMNADERG